MIYIYTIALVFVVSECNFYGKYEFMFKLKTIERISF